MVTKPDSVIRRVEVAEEETSSRVLNRHLPAWVVSGALHVAIIGFFLLVFSTTKEAEAKPMDLVSVTVEDPAEVAANLVEEDPGFDPKLDPAADAKREAEVNVTAEMSEDPPGLDNQPDAIAPHTQAPGFSGFETGVSAPLASDPGQAPGDGGSGTFMMPGLRGRGPATKNALLKSGGGTPESEAAVGRGLAWLARKQLKDGSWEFDGSSKDKIAATGMALLPFLAAGETHKFGNEVQEDGRKRPELADRPSSAPAASLRDQQHVRPRHRHGGPVRGGRDDQGPEGQGQGHAGRQLHRQRPGPQRVVGVHRARRQSEGDTSIVGWQIQALASAKLAEIKFEKDKVYKEANKFLESVSTDSGRSTATARRALADADAGRAVEPVLHGGDEPAAPGVRAGGGLPQAVPAAEGLLRHVLLLLRHPGGPLLRGAGLAQVLEPADAGPADRPAAKGRRATTCWELGQGPGVHRQRVRAAGDHLLAVDPGGVLSPPAAVQAGQRRGWRNWSAALRRKRRMNRPANLGRPTCGANRFREHGGASRK